MAKQGLNISLSADIEKFRKGFEDAVKITKGSTANIESEAKQMADTIVQQLGRIGAAKSFRAANLQTQELVRTMKLFGMEGSAAFREVVKTAGKLKDEMEDTKGLIAAAAPGGAFKAFAGTLQGVAQGFAGVQGAMALFGNESEDVHKAMLKIQAAMAFAEGFKAIEGLKDSFDQLGQVIKMNPMLAIATAAALAGAAIYAFSQHTSSATSIQQAFNRVSEKAADNTAQERIHLESLMRTAKNEKLSREARQVAIDEMNDKYPKTLGNLNLENINTQETANAYKKLTAAIMQKAKVQAAEEELVDLYKQQRQALKDLAAEQKAQKEGGFIQGLKDDFSVLRGTGGMDALMGAGAIQGDIDDLKTLVDELNKVPAVVEEIVKPTTSGNGSADAIKKVVEEMGFHASEFAKLSGTNSNDEMIAMLNNSAKAAEGLNRSLSGTVKTITLVGPSSKRLAADLATARKAMGETSIAAKEMNLLIESNLENMAFNLGEALGSAFAGADVDFGSVILMAMADFSTQLGKMMISQAIQIAAFKKALQLGQWQVALVAGVALVAAGAAVRHKLKQGPKFADGGIVGGHSNTGDRVPALVNSGEMILNKAQQGNLFKMVNSGSSGGGGSWAFKVTPREIFMLYEEGKRQIGRG